MHNRTSINRLKTATCHLCWRIFNNQATCQRIRVFFPSTQQFCQYDTILVFFVQVMRNTGSAFWQMTARWRLNSEKSIFIYSQILRIKSVPLYDWINLAGISYPKNFIGGYIVQWTINQKKKPALGIFKFRPITHLQSIFTWLCLTTTEADPGFPRRRRQPMSLGQKPIIWQDFCRKLWKWTLAPPCIRQWTASSPHHLRNSNDTKFTVTY